MNKRKAPMEKKELPMIGMIQWMELRPDQPNQKRQIGMRKAPTKAGLSRNSGLSSPFSLNSGSRYLRTHQKKGGMTMIAPMRIPRKASPCMPGEKW